MEHNGYLKMKKYFENLVNNSKFLNGFAGFFARELLNKLASKKEPLQAPYLALFRYNLGLDGQEQNTQAVRKLGFSIILHNIKPDNYEAQYEAIDLAESLALKVLARIFFDNKKTDHFLWNSIIKESIQIVPLDHEKIGFGVEVMFNLKNKQSMKLDPEDWKDVASVC
jgi:hypothetical protein